MHSLNSSRRHIHVLPGPYQAGYFLELVRGLPICSRKQTKRWCDKAHHPDRSCILPSLQASVLALHVRGQCCATCGDAPNIQEIRTVPRGVAQKCFLNVFTLIVKLLFSQQLHLWEKQSMTPDMLTPFGYSDWQLLRYILKTIFSMVLHRIQALECAHAT